MRTRLARLLVLGSLLAGSGAVAATPPPQPKEGPGGSDYMAASVAKRAVGRASSGSYVFHAEGPAAEPRPVVVFLHAWGATNPQAYGGWIEHLARKGNLVIVPRFQEVGRTRPMEATERATTLVKEAFAALAGDPQARPDRDKVAFVGHLAGAALAANLAALAGPQGIPAPKLVFAVMPGGIAKDAKSRGIALSDLSAIDPSTLIVTMIGDRDFRAADLAAKRILREATNVPESRKGFMRALSDGHGFPTLSATLIAPGAASNAYDGAAIKLPPDPPREKGQPQPRAPKWSPDMVLTGEQSVLVAQLAAAGTDTLDYHAFWKTLDLAMAAAFSGRDAQALRADPRLVDMGRWSDNTPVKRLAAETPRAEGGSAAARNSSAPSMQPVPNRKR